MEDVIKKTQTALQGLKSSFLGDEPLSATSGLTVTFLCLMPPYIWIISAKPFFVDWMMVCAIMMGELAIIVMQIPERLQQVSRSSKNKPEPPVEGLALDYKEVGGLMLLTQYEPVIGFLGVPEDVFKSYNTVYSVFVAVLVIYSLLRNLEGSLIDLRKFHVAELAYHVILVLKCRPAEFVLHFLLMQTFMKASTYLLRMTASALLSRAPPEIRTMSRGHLKKFL